MIPADLEKYTGGCQTLLYDGNCGEPIGVGYNLQKLSMENSNRLMEAVKGEKIYTPSKGWIYIISFLTREEAIEKYGNITEEVYGPRGGWKSVTFGTTKFIANHLRP